MTQPNLSKARRNLKPEAFIELNPQTVVEVCYQEQDYQTWQGFRLLATAGSQIRF